MAFAEIISHIASSIKEPLPGITAHLRMASQSRIQWLREGIDSSRAKRSGVLILLYPHNGRIMTVLILRPDYDGTHGGQVSLPGGKYEDGDESLIATALRETEEELGIVTDNIHILGPLSELYIPPSNFLVLPVVGYVTERPVFDPDPDEVKDIIEIDIAHLSDPQFRGIKKIDVHGHTLTAPCYTVNGSVIWGATAMILSEFEYLVSGI